MVVWSGVPDSAAEQSIVPRAGLTRSGGSLSAARRARSKDPELASDQRIEERELEAGGLNQAKQGLDTSSVACAESRSLRPDRWDW